VTANDVGGEYVDYHASSREPKPASVVAPETAAQDTRAVGRGAGRTRIGEPRMARTEIVDADWDLIVERIYKRRCVPFLGAGANVTTGGDGGLPLGGAVAKSLVEELTKTRVAQFADLASVSHHEALSGYPDLLRIGAQDLARVALHLTERDDYGKLKELLQEIIPDRERRPSRLLQTLASLRTPYRAPNETPEPGAPAPSERTPFRLIVTSNYDRLMEIALDEAGVALERVIQPVEGFEERQRTGLDEELAAVGDKLVVYKIHGSFLDEEEDVPPFDRLLITEEDYIQFLTVAATADRGVPQAISKEMTTSTLLFLGYSLEDWDFRTIFKGLIESLLAHQRRKSFAIQVRPPEFWVKFWEKKGVNIYDVELDEFAAQLDARYGEYVERMREPD
jgi:hypothetical protein